MAYSMLIGTEYLDIFTETDIQIKSPDGMYFGSA